MTPVFKPCLSLTGKWAVGLGSPAANYRCGLSLENPGAFSPVRDDIMT